MPDYFDTISSIVRTRILDRYELLHNPVLSYAIAYSILSEPVGYLTVLYNNITVIDLVEAGVIKLERAGELGFIIKIPYNFVWCHFNNCTDLQFPQFWNSLLIGKDIQWNEWGVFCRNYIAFRLSLYRFLGKTRVPYQNFFRGAVFNMPKEVNDEICIPSMDELELLKLTERYPAKNCNLAIGQCALNASGAPFDACVKLNMVSESFGNEMEQDVLLTLQMKLSAVDATTAKIDINDINDEFNKTNDAMLKYLPNKSFIFVMLCRRDGKIDANMLPGKSVIVTNSEMNAFFGDLYYGRLQAQ